MGSKIQASSTIGTPNKKEKSREKILEATISRENDYAEP
jgi:hypothetical protein